jgi:hypothetical protein
MLTEEKLDILIARPGSDNDPGSGRGVLQPSGVCRTKRPPGANVSPVMGIIIAGSAAVAAAALWVRFVGHLEKAVKEADGR